MLGRGREAMIIIYFQEVEAVSAIEPVTEHLRFYQPPEQFTLWPASADQEKESLFAMLSCLL